VRASEFVQLVRTVGVPVSHVTLAGQRTAITGVVQSTARGSDAVVNAYGLNGVAVQALAVDLPAPPVKFDSLEVNGELYTVDSVSAKRETVSGSIMGWVMYCRGR
jgi:hypothetical protein